MKGLFISLCIGLLCFAGCGKRSAVELDRKDIIDRQKMIMLMADLDITEAALRVKQTYIPRDSLSKLTKIAYDSLYIYYNTTPAIFVENLKFYQEDMEDYLEMVNEKIELLIRKKDSVALAPEKLDTTRMKITRPKVSDSAGLKTNALK